MWDGLIKSTKYFLSYRCKERFVHTRYVIYRYRNEGAKCGEGSRREGGWERKQWVLRKGKSQG